MESQLTMEFIFSWFYTICLYGAIVYLLTLIYWCGFGRYRILKQLGISGPKPLPFIGHMGDFAKGEFQIHLVLDEYVKKYGTCFGMYYLGIPTIVVSDPEMLRQIMVQDFTKFHDRAYFGELPEPMNSNLVLVRGERWKFIRGKLTPSFTSNKVKLMAGLTNQICDTFITKCRQCAKTGEPADMGKFNQGFTMEVILASAFGIKARSQTDPNDPLTAMAKRALRNPSWIGLLSLIPGGGRLIRHLPYGFSYLIEPLMKVTKDIIKERRKEESHDRKDLLQLMLDAQAEGDKSGRTLTDNEVLGQALIFLLAGYETSSSTLALTFYHLAVHQDVQEKVYQEINDKIGQDGSLLDYEATQKLEYLDMVICETMRLYPSGYLLIRDCTKECKVKDIPFQKGFTVLIPTYSIHRSDLFWKDPEKFDPDRFSEEEKAKRDSFSYLPFGHGPRNCIGMRFAQMEMKILLARIVREFRLEVCSDTKIPPRMVSEGNLTLKDPVNLKVVSRKTSD